MDSSGDKVGVGDCVPFPLTTSRGHLGPSCCQKRSWHAPAGAGQASRGTQAQALDLCRFNMPCMPSTPLRLRFPLLAAPKTIGLKGGRNSAAVSRLTT